MLCTLIPLLNPWMQIQLTAGELINERDRCGHCKGKKVTREKKMVQVQVETGMQHGQRIVFDGEADEAVSWGKFYLNSCYS